MITKIELQETNYFENSIIIVDFGSNQITCFKNDCIIKNQQHAFSVEEFDKFLKTYITYWDLKYVDASIIGGNESTLTIYTHDETIRYQFKNKYPYNYDAFIGAFKEMVNI